MSTARNARPARRRSERQIEASAQNRVAMVRSALELFANYGYTNTTLHAIADRVGLTRQGLLHHFGSKEGLFLEVIEQERHWAAEQIRRATRERGLGGLSGMTTFIGRASEIVHLKFVHTLQAEAIHDDAPDYVTAYARNRLGHIRDEVTARLAEAQEDGELGDAELPTLTALITATIVGLQAQRLVDDSVPAVEAFELLVQRLPSLTARNNLHTD